MVSDWDRRRCGHKSNWLREYLFIRIPVFTAVVYKLLSPRSVMTPRMLHEPSFLYPPWGWELGIAGAPNRTNISNNWIATSAARFEVRGRMIHNFVR